jgi:hypothetical protein
VTGNAKTAEIGYTIPTGSIFVDPKRPLPFTYTWSTAKPNDILLLSAQIDTFGDGGSVRVSISRDGTEIGSDAATGFPNSATVSARY